MQASIGAGNQKYHDEPLDIPRAVITHLTVDTLRGDVVVSECFRMFQLCYDIFVTLCCWVFRSDLTAFFGVEICFFTKQQ